jgi:phosphoenolpyruvate carboxylase
LLLAGGAIKASLDKNPSNLALMQTMYNEWPFFQVTIDLIEMVFAKADPRVAQMYDRLLVSPRPLL